MSKLLVIDNYDSFTYNLVQMFMLYDLRINVFRCDRISIDQVGAISPDYILISPGPKDPQHAGISIQVVRTFFTKVPILGVCLGMQCINEAFEGETIRASIPMHGKTSVIQHIQRGLFKDIPSPFTAARYHSLITQLNGKNLVVTAQTPDGVIMGLSHPIYPLHGIQFHPESFLTEYGFQLVENFLALGSYKKA